MNSVEWKKQWDCRQLRPLIICRGPVRKEAMDCFTRMGLSHFGILLSEKDAIFHPLAVAPECRQINPKHVHRITDYTGLDKQERLKRVDDILRIAREHHYNAIFAGYGFMAEEADLVLAVEEAGLIFIGPCSHTVAVAGQKDKAKQVAEKVGVTTIPGVDRLAANTLLAANPTFIDLQRVADEHGLAVDFNALINEQDMSIIADHLLEAAMRKGVELFTIDALGAQAVLEVASIYRNNPHDKVRLKAILGGGGKGQRIVASPKEFKGDLESCINQAVADVPHHIVAILNEVKATGTSDNKNILIELNIESTRHQEVQLVGNGEWAVSMGARDCSLQMHEQKLIEFSQTEEGLNAEIAALEDIGSHRQVAALKKDLLVLAAMEHEAVRFAQAVKLDSVSTFECIVSNDQHYFMEMNTRIQVEHRVTELCYALRFCNPDNSEDFFDVESIIELMVLLATHKARLPKPVRIPRAVASVELRVNATNQALQPHAGGEIRYWTPVAADEIRDDQGISMLHPDTGRFQSYYISGAYDSNIALLLTTGGSRREAVTKMVEIVRQMQISGVELETNLDFHHGLLHWLLNNGVYAKVNTAFVKQYVALIGAVKARASEIDWSVITSHLLAFYGERYGASVVAPILHQKMPMVYRVLSLLVERPHLLSAWLSSVGCQLSIAQDADPDLASDAKPHLKLESKPKSKPKSKPVNLFWKENPVKLLKQTYHLLNMDDRAGRAPCEVLWTEDKIWLEEAYRFYQSLEALAQTVNVNHYAQVQEWIRQSRVPKAPLETGEKSITIGQQVWQSLQSAHMGFQIGLEVMGILSLDAWEAGFYQLHVKPSLEIAYPASQATMNESAIRHTKLDPLDSLWQKRMFQQLEPPLERHGNLIVAASGGMIYLQPAPNKPPFFRVGDSFKQGETLYIIEVMKMFNAVRATFSGRIDTIMIENIAGQVVKTGQPIFKVTPSRDPDDGYHALSSEEEVAASRQFKSKVLINMLQ